MITDLPQFAVDYRKVNQVTRPISFSLPRLEDIFDTIGEAQAQIFTVLDLRSGFWQLPLDPKTKDRTAFTVHSGNFQFKKLPFGLKNAPMSFQMVMSQVLRGLTWKCALVYIDDILVYSKNFSSHLQHLEAIFNRLDNANLKLNPSKCAFATKRVTYLGHEISKHGVEIDHSKTHAIESYPVPKNAKEVKSFVAMCNFYRKFVKGFANITAPLNRLSSNNVRFHWSSECQAAFERLKQALISAPILAYPNFDKQFILRVDASGYSISYILSQLLDDSGKAVTVSYGGRSLTQNERKWSITEREGLALFEGIKHYHVYLANTKFAVYTDHISLKWIHTIQNAHGRLHRWSILFQGYNFQVEHLSGKSNVVADALSRRPYPEESKKPPLTDDDYELNCLSDNQAETNLTEYCLKYEPELHILPTISEITKPEDIDQLPDIALRQINDTQLKPIIEYLDSNILPTDDKEARHVLLESQDYIFENGVLYHLYYPRGKGHKADRLIKQLIVPQVLRNDVLLSYHDSLLGGHQGMERTYQSIRQKYFWPRMFSDIESYVTSCEICQQVKRNYHAMPAPLQPLPAGDTFSRLHLDFLGPLKKTSNGHQYILLVVDSFSKWCEAFPLKTMHASEVARILYNEIICRYGAPSSILTDRGADFVSKLMNELCQIFQITKITTSSYHPQTNAACERMNSVILQGLRAYCKPDQSNWHEILPSIMLAYRTTPATQSTGLSPYFILFGKECTLPIDTALHPHSNNSNLGKNAQESLDRILTSFEITKSIVRENTAQAKSKYKQQFDKRSKVPKFKIGQRVWLYCQQTPVGLSPKLCKKWVGPYYICNAYDNFTYKLRNCATNKLVNSVVHANRLKAYFDPKDRPVGQPTTLDIEDNLNPEEISDSENSPRPNTSEMKTGSTNKIKVTKPMAVDNKTTPVVFGKPTPSLSRRNSSNPSKHDQPDLGMTKVTKTKNVMNDVDKDKSEKQQLVYC